MNSLKAKLQKQAGQKTIVVKVYAPSDEDAYLYRLFLFTWSTQNGYDEPDEDTDGLGNYTFTLYKPSKEELEQRRIAAEKKAKTKAQKEANEREKIFAEDPIAAFSYAIYTSDFELFKKYYYPYKELVKKERVENSGELGDTNVFYYIDDSKSKILNHVSYKKYYSHNNSFDYPYNSDNIISLLWKANDKFFYDAIEFLEKDGTLLWQYVYLYNLPTPIRYKEKIKHEDVDRLCFVIKK